MREPGHTTSQGQGRQWPSKQTDTCMDCRKPNNQCCVDASPCPEVDERTLKTMAAHPRSLPSSHDVCAVRQPLAVVPILRIPTQGCPGPGHSTPPSWPSCTALNCTQQQSRAKGAQAARQCVSSDCSSTHYRTRNTKSPTLACRAPFTPLAHRGHKPSPRRRPAWTGGADQDGKRHGPPCEEPRQPRIASPMQCS